MLHDESNTGIQATPIYSHILLPASGPNHRPPLSDRGPYDLVEPLQLFKKNMLQTKSIAYYLRVVDCVLKVLCSTMLIVTEKNGEKLHCH